MKLPVIKIGPPSDHFSEILLLGGVAGGVIFYMIHGIGLKADLDEPACLVVLTLIVGAIKERWTQRSVDRMGQSLANAPAADPPATMP